MRITFIVFALLAAGLSNARAADIKGVAVTPLLSTTTTADGQRIAVPAHPEVVATLYEIAPGAVLPVHKHPYPRYAYVLSGTIDVTVSDGTAFRYKTGDFIVEVVNRWHSGKNIGDAPVRLLVIDQVPPGRSNTIIRTDKDKDAAARP